jgi:predicted phage baseplate assembly protein
MPIPLPNLDDKTFDQLAEEAKRRISVYTPQWTDHNVHDPAITFIELFAWLAEMQLYNLDRIGDRNYLKFLKLLGVKPLPARPSKVDITFTSDVIAEISKLTAVIAEDIQTGEKLTFEIDEDFKVLPAELKSVVSFANYNFAEVTAFNAPNKNLYYPLGERAEAGSALYLGFDFEDDIVGKDPEPSLYLSFYLYEEDLPPRGQHGDERLKIYYPSAEVAWEYWGGEEWSTLALGPSTDEMVKTLSWSGRISLSIASDWERCTLPSIDKNLYWMRCRVVKGGYEIPPRLDRILPNTVSATEGITIKGEDLGSSTGLPNQVFPTKHRPVIYGTQQVDISGEIWGKGEKGEAAYDFDASQPEDKHYLLDADKGTITFGDGVRGRIPPKDTEIKLSYRYGGGQRGDIGAQTINQTLTAYDESEAPVEVKAVNHFPASGGREEETIPEAILGARREQKIPFRAVTSDDFESIAKATPELRVARAKAIITSKNLVTVVVAPYSPLEKATPSPGFMKTVCEHLDMHRLITTDIKVAEPDYVQISVSALVKIKSGYKPEAVRERVEKRLNRFLSPLEGGPEAKGWPFGRSVYQSEVYEVIEGVEGVDCALKLALNGVTTDLDIGDLGLVYPGRHDIEIIEPQTVCKE